MKNRTAAILVVAALAVACNPTSIEYPVARTEDVTDTWHGTEVPDPYRWLEDPDSEETGAWVTAQNKVTFSFLETIPERDQIRKRLTELWNYERFETPFIEGGRFFYERNDGLQNQFVLWVADDKDAPGRVLLDPNTLSADGTLALADTAVSPDGRWLAYGTASAGSDWQEWHVRNIETGEDLDDHLRWIKFFTPEWNQHSTGLYYTRFDEPESQQELAETNYFTKVYYHQVGTPQSEDQLIYERPDQKEWILESKPTEDGRYLLISARRGTDHLSLLFYCDLSDGVSSPQVSELIGEFKASLDYLASDGPLLYLKTDYDAPRGRVIALDLANPDTSAWQEVIPEGDDAIDKVKVVNNTFIVSYLKDARARVNRYGMDGSDLGELDLPGIGTVSSFTGHRSHSETFYSFESYTMPETVFHLDLTTGTSTVFRPSKVAFDPADFTTEQVFVPSRDGTLVPVFLNYRKDLARDRPSPTVLYGYGGFNAAIKPRFRVKSIGWMEMGGIWAVANIRGGSEYGEEWHQAGMLANKQNCFDDFIAVAEWLIANDYTVPEKLAVSGASNGGTLVGAVVNQRPELFGAALPAVGVMDMLRFPLFTIGWAWVSDYGSPEDPEMFKVLLSYSPLHNIKPGTSYPAVMVTTADHDDRVVPGHSFKYAAALQAAQAGPAPILIRIETKAGHGSGKPTSKRIDEATDILAFLCKTLTLGPPS